MKSLGKWSCSRVDLWTTSSPGPTAPSPARPLRSSRSESISLTLSWNVACAATFNCCCCCCSVANNLHYCYIDFRIRLAAIPTIPHPHLRLPLTPPTGGNYFGCLRFSLINIKHKREISKWFRLYINMYNNLSVLTNTFPHEIMLSMRVFPERVENPMLLYSFVI